MSRAHISIDSIFQDFNLTENENTPTLKDGGPATIWLPKEYKARFDELQKKSKRKFGRKLREMIQAAIDHVEV